MGFRFRKRIKILPGLWLNVSKSGVSTTAKVGRVRVTKGHGRTTTSVDLPGPLGYTKTTRKSKKTREN
jgi:hypothetical protein